MNDNNRTTFAEPESAGTLHRTATSHIGLRVPDVAACVEFYGRVLGMAVHAELAGGGMRMGWGSGHHVIDLLPGETSLDHLAFEVGEPGGLPALEKRLRDAGHEVRPLDESFVDEPVDDAKGLACTDPDGNTVHFHAPVRRPGEHAADTRTRPIKYQHITLATHDVAKMTDFYTRLAGFRISDQLDDGGFVWLRSNRDHHTLAIVHNQQPGLDHYSYDLAEWADFKTWCDRLTEEGIDVVWGPGRHGPGNNLFIFFDDPAGNHVELSAELEKFHDDRVTYTPRQWDPVPRSVNLWGGQLANWRRTSEGN